MQRKKDLGKSVDDTTCRAHLREHVGSDTSTW